MYGWRRAICSLMLASGLTALSGSALSPQGPSDGNQEETSGEPPPYPKTPQLKAPSTVNPSSGRTAEDESPGWHGNKNFVLYRSAPGAEINELEGDRIELRRGEAVFEPVRPIIVITPLSEAHVMRKSAVLFRVQKGSERLMVLWDTGLDSVVLVAHKRKLRLGPGSEALVSDHDPNYREITEPDDIGRRRIKLHDCGTHKHVVTSEFSLLHALQRDPLLYDVAHSKDPHDRALREHMLKTAAVLNMVTQGHGYYTTSSGF